MKPERVALRKLISGLPAGITWAAPADTRVSGVAIDSRRVQPGQLFVALRGASRDGNDFIDQAVAAGAGAVVGERELTGLPVPYVRLANAREALTWLSAAFYDWPGRKLTVVGVTGTDGKTTTTNLIHQVLLAAHMKAGMISTVNAVIGDRVLDTGFHVTTPDAHDLQGYLAEMVEAGLTHAVLETTSHGWAQHRADACEFDVGVITNITHEHLDEHGSYENYRAAKARLLQALLRTSTKAHGNPRLAVINRDDQSFAYLNAIAGVKKLSYGLSAEADVRGLEVVATGAGLEFRVQGQGLSATISSGMVGMFNVSNCLAALTATVCGLDVNLAEAAEGIRTARDIPGRMERIEMGQRFTAIVDFAHTPNALRVALQAARGLLAGPASTARRRPALTAGAVPHPKGGRLIVVFGSAGLRDRQKRRLMAETAAELADLAILTAEDPRTESLDGILTEMAAGATSRGGRHGETFWRVPDRGEAIRMAVSKARQGDLVIACGKGHEQSMCFGTREHSWDDRTAMRAALAELLGTHGPEMPYLPTGDTPEEEWLRWT